MQRTHIFRTSNARTSKRTSNAVLTQPARISQLILRISTNRVTEILTFSFTSSQWPCAPLRIPDWWCHVRVSAVLGLCYRTKTHTNPCHKNAALRPYHYSHAHSTRYRLLWPRPPRTAAGYHLALLNLGVCARVANARPAPWSSSARKSCAIAPPPCRCTWIGA